MKQAEHAYWGIIDPSQLPVLVQTTDSAHGTPEIDAEEDEIWTNAEEVETEVWVPDDSGSTGTVKTMWDDERFYVYFTVTDAQLSKAASNPWEQDSIKVYVDQNNA